MESKNGYSSNSSDNVWCEAEEIVEYHGKKHKKKKKSKHKRTKKEKSNLYFKDKKADPENYEFESLYKLHIPLYNPFRKTLGVTPKHQVIGKKLKKDSKNLKKRYFCQANTKTETLLVVIKDSKMEEWKDFVTLSNRDYQDESPSFNPMSVVSKNQEFSAKLLESPNNIELWKEFISYQDCCFESFSDGHITGKYFKNLIERKLSIVDKALVKNMTCIELIILKMSLLKEVNTSDVMRDLWKQKIFQFPNSTCLWQEYLLYLQTDLLSMNVVNITEAYRKAFGMLIGLINGTVKSHKVEDNALLGFILLLTQYVIFQWQAGFTEKAICTLECIIQYNISEALEEKDHFEKVFESSHTRFGSKVTCWLQCNAGKNTASVAAIPVDMTKPDGIFEERIQFASSQVSQRKEALWMELEDLRSLLEFEPCEANSDCTDTDRIILFDDISFALLKINNPDLIFQVVLVYFMLLGVPIDRRILDTKILQVFEKYFLVDDNAGARCYCHLNNCQEYVCISSILQLNSEQINVVALKKIRSAFQQSLVLLKKPYSVYISQLWLHFESTVFLNKSINKATVGIESYGKVLRKFYKSMFKITENRDNISLWIMYASHEKYSGKEELYKKILLSSLHLIQGKAYRNLCFSPVATIVKFIVQSTIEVCYDFTFDCITDEKKHFILNSYLSFLDVNKLDALKADALHATDLLKLSSLFQSGFKLCTMNHSEDLIYVSDFLYCYVVFEYLFRGISEIITICDNVIAYQRDLVARSCNVQPMTLPCNAHDSIAFMLVAISLEIKNDYKLFPYYRKTLKSALELFPESRCFNNVYIGVKHFGMDGVNARKLFEKNIVTTKSIQPWLYYIAFDKNYLEKFDKSSFQNCGDSKSGIYHRIKSTYERLVTHSSYCYCVDLWINYVTFEIENGKRDNAVEAFNKALRYCCGSKKLITYACGKLDIFQEGYNLLSEKGLRIRLFIEEMELLLENIK